jgi:hypothetical protein
MWILIATISAAASLAVLYALHRRRAPARPRAVATLQFWRAAVGPDAEANARPTARLERPWAFLLLAASVLALGVAAALPPARVSPRVVVLDAGSAMRWSTDDAPTPLDRAVDAVEAGLTTACPAAVVVADGRPRLIARGEDGVAAVRAALESVRSARPGTEPVATGSALAINLAGQLTEADVDWYTDEAAVPDGVAPAAAARVHVRRPAASDGRAAVVNVWFNSDDRLSVRVARSASRSPRPLAIELDRPGQPARSCPVVFPPTARTADVAFDHVPADGGSASILLRTAGDATIQSLPVRLPASPEVAVRCLPGVPAALRAAADVAGGPAVVGAAVVAVLPRGDPRPPDATGTVWSISGGADVAPGSQIIADPADPLTAGLDLEGAVSAGGPAVSGGQPILWAGGRVVASIDPAARAASFSTAVTGDAADLPRHAAFPVLLARVFRRLGGRTELPPVVPASRLVTDPLWRGGGLDAEPIATADLPVDGPGPAPAPPVRAVGRRRMPDPSTWALAIGLGLLCVEDLFRPARRVGQP